MKLSLDFGESEMAQSTLEVSLHLLLKGRDARIDDPIAGIMLPSCLLKFAHTFASATTRSLWGRSSELIFKFCMAYQNRRNINDLARETEERWVQTHSLRSKANWKLPRPEVSHQLMVSKSSRRRYGPYIASRDPAMIDSHRNNPRHNTWCVWMRMIPER